MFTRPAKILRPPLAVPPRPGPAPRFSSHLPGPWVTRHQRGFTHVRPSGLPLACAPGWNGTRFGFSPELRTPRLPATHVRAGTGLEHWPGATSPTSSALQSTHSLATCSLVSHVLGPVIPHEQSHMFSRPRSRISSAACGRTISALMKQCSRPTPGGRARHPSSDQLSRPAGRGTISAQDSQSRRQECSPAGGYQARVCRMADPLALIRRSAPCGLTTRTCYYLSTTVALVLAAAGVRNQTPGRPPVTRPGPPD